jgi:hypothetical protein
MGGDLFAGMAGLFGGDDGAPLAGIGDRGGVLDAEASEAGVGELPPGDEA